MKIVDANASMLTRQASKKIFTVVSIYFFLTFSLTFICSYFQFSGDMEDLEQALTKKPSNKKVVGSGSCSALVKLFEKNQDLAISQVTWNDFNAMLRIYKMYNFSHHEYIGGNMHQIFLTAHLTAYHYIV